MKLRTLNRSRFPLLAFCLLLLGSLMASSVAECRVGGGRSFGNRGSRGFTAPRNSYSNPYSHSYNSPYQAQPAQPPRDYSLNQSYPSSRGSFMKSLGAGMAGGLLGGMLFRSLGGGGYGGGYGGAGYGGGGGIGPLEILILGALLFWLIRIFTKRNQAQSSSASSESSSSGAESLMRQARPMGWQDRPADSGRNDSSGSGVSDGMPINTDMAMDFFFQIQGAWGNRDLSGIQNILDSEARSYLEQEISHLKSVRQINRLENIAVRTVEVTESWREGSREYSTVRFTANLLDFTVSEDSQQVVEGSKTVPVKFEEFWTFARENGSSTWKLAAIQQI